VQLLDSSPQTPPGDNTDDGTEGLALHSGEIFSETGGDNNLKIWDALIRKSESRLTTKTSLSFRRAPLKIAPDSSQRFASRIIS
jgi:hypothetical protein